MLSDLGSKAEEYFRKGYNGAEALAKAIAEMYQIDYKWASNIATPFGGGLGGKGSICGCLAGGMIGIGYLYGRTDAEDKEKKTLAYEKAKLFYERFMDKFGTVSCRELCGMDLSTEEGREQFEKENIRGKCAEYVRESGNMLADIL
ncbi:MAG: C-GCAxxG-C-C family protein [Thermoplasmata archaeon]